MTIFQTIKTAFNMRLLGVVTLGLMCGFTPFSAAQAQQIVDPCPVPEALAKKSPSDMAAVQADIDILTLCVRRAGLLSELNDLVTDDMLLPKTGSAAQDSIVPNFQDENFEPVDSDLFRLPDTEDESTALPDTSRQSMFDVEEEQEKKEEKKEYKVIGINGNQASGVVARLRTPEGDVVQVKAGDVLNDGAQVQNVSIQGVTVVMQGTPKTLGWE